MTGGKDNTASLQMGPHIELEDLMALVLEQPPPQEARAIEQHLDGQEGGGNGDGEAGCSWCRQELESLREELGEYALAAVQMEPAPAGSRERLLSALARSSQPDTREQGMIEPGLTQPGLTQPDVIQLDTREPAAGWSERPAVNGGRAAPAPSGPVTLGPATLGPSTPGPVLVASSRSSKAAAWAGWAAAAAMALFAIHFYQGREAMRASVAGASGQIAALSAQQARTGEVLAALTDRSAQRATLTLTKAPVEVQPSGRATYLASKGTLIFLGSHLAPVPAGKSYELWVIPASGGAPVAAGTFVPDEHGNAAVITANLQQAGAAKAFGITLENAGGSPTPTLPILMAGS